VNTIARLSLIAVALAVPAAAQDQTPPRPIERPDEVVVFLNAAGQENRTCVTYLEWAHGQATCPAADDLRLYLTQGKRMQFRVINRRFFSDYTITIDGVTQLKQIPIQDLEEAANLQVPAPSAGAPAAKGVALKGLAVSGLLQLRTSQDLLAELVDEGKSSNPANEILSDWLVVQRAENKVDEEIKALDVVWEVLDGGAAARNCQQNFGAPTISSTLGCLNAIYDYETRGSWTRQPYTDEDDFRHLIVEVNDTVIMVKAFGDAVAQSSAKMNAQISALDDDVSKLNADLNTLSGNIVAANNAVTAFQYLQRDLPAPGTEDALTALRRAQIKLKLIQDLNSGGTAGKTVLDDAELNKLLASFSEYLKHSGEIAARDKDRLHDSATSARLGLIGLFVTLCPDNPLQCEYAQTHTKSLTNGIRHLNVELPAQIDQINAMQSQVLARANEIYDHSEVSEPLDKVIDLGKNAGNLHIYFSVRRIDVFPRYVVPVVVAPAAAQQGTPLPPPAANAAPANGNAPAPSPAPAGPDQSPGVVVAHGVFEVHDFYRATVVGAFAFSGVKDVSVKSKTIISGTATDGSTCSASTPCSQPFLSKGAYLPSLLIGVTYYLSARGHDTFPHASNRWNQNLGVLGGLSATKLNSYFIGLSYEPAQAFQIGAGVNFVSQDAISSQFDPKKAYAGNPSFGGSSSWGRGAFVSAGLNLSIFRKIFGSVTGLGTKATGAGN
jgi:hypothetical protein